MRRKLLPLLLVLLAAGAGYAVYWQSKAQKVEEAAQDAARMLDGQGIDSDFDWRDATGFPYRLQMSSDGAALAGEVWPVDWRLQANSLDLFAQPWTQDHVVALISGLEIHLGRWRLNAAEPQVSWLRDGAGLRLDADLGDSTLQTGDGADSRIRVGRLQLHLRHRDDKTSSGDGLHPGGRWQMALSARDVAPDAAIAELPPSGITRLMLDMSVYGPLNAPFARADIEAWRDAGGIVEIDSFTLSADGLSVTGSGSLTLDEDARPMGALTLSTAAPQRLIALLARLGAISPEAQPLARQAVQAAVAAAGKGETIDLPLTLQDGKFQLAGLDLNMIAPLD